MGTNSEYESYQKARKKVKEIKGFYIHLLCYLLVVFLLVYLNLNYSPKQLWFIYPLVGWGVGLLGHAAGVFGADMLFSRNWEERKLKEYMKEENRKSKNL